MQHTFIDFKKNEISVGLFYIVDRILLNFYLRNRLVIIVLEELLCHIGCVKERDLALCLKACNLFMK